MKTSQEWAEIYMISPVLQLKDVIEMAQKEAYNQAIDDAIDELPDRMLVYSDPYDYSCGVEGKDNYYIDYIRELKK